MPSSNFKERPQLDKLLKVNSKIKLPIEVSARPGKSKRALLLMVSFCNSFNVKNSASTTKGILNKSKNRQSATLRMIPESTDGSIPPTILAIPQVLAALAC